MFCHCYGVDYALQTQGVKLSTAPSFDGTQVCVQVDPEMFFPELPEKPTSADRLAFKQAIIDAKKACTLCKFNIECLDYALQNDVVGVWGATTERERWHLRKEKKLPTPKSITLITNAWVNQKGAR